MPHCQICSVDDKSSFGTRWEVLWLPLTLPLGSFEILTNSFTRKENQTPRNFKRKECNNKNLLFLMFNFLQYRVKRPSCGQWSEELGGRLLELPALPLSVSQRVFQVLSDCSQGVRLECGMVDHHRKIICLGCCYPGPGLVTH